ncbi:hypothetical protein AQUCO_04700025v1 [Aquilegia coerulea]|uniref:LysM domain-containing protein n=1 Tax=Aquilegia coerulea TaxID=218851 RepID=A0A2G5CKS7_AQUCA|nr:hypothetical protein AQUCO_04700025v1 [Aquilegia coerulea]
MAKIINLILLISLLLIVSIAEGRTFGNKKIDSTLQCEAVYGVQAGDSCLGITQMFNLAPQLFNEINPNIACDELFVGQWVCTSGVIN